MAAGEPAVNLPSRVYTLDLPPFLSHIHESFKASQAGRHRTTTIFGEGTQRAPLIDFRLPGGETKVGGAFLVNFVWLAIQRMVHWWFGVTGDP